ncbi:hypothetical protein AVEN_79991-1, partial [Araneus ventricosus]
PVDRADGLHDTSVANHCNFRQFPLSSARSPTNLPECHVSKDSGAFSESRGKCMNDVM